MCSERIGFMKGGYALSHQQVENEDPLTFFVLREGETIVNPKILNHTKTTVDSRELCLSFPYINREILKQRWNVIEVEYYGIYGEGFTKKRKRLSGKESHVWQHEMDHFDCKYIFDI
jgi:peptide deformylase